MGFSKGVSPWFWWAFLFYLEQYSTLFLALFWPITNKEKKIEFWGKPWVNPFAKNVILGDLKCLSPKKVFFLSRILLIIISFLWRLWKMEFKITSPIPFEFDYHFHDISYFVFFCSDLLDCLMISPCDV